MARSERAIAAYRFLSESRGASCGTPGSESYTQFKARTCLHVSTRQVDRCVERMVEPCLVSRGTRNEEGMVSQWFSLRSPLHDAIKRMVGLRPALNSFSVV